MYMKTPQPYILFCILTIQVFNSNIDPTNLLKTHFQYESKL